MISLLSAFSIQNYKGQPHEIEYAPSMPVMYKRSMSRTSPLPLSVVSGASTRATSLYDELHADLLAGDLEPGSKLVLEALAERYSSSARH
jgi:Bacterial regulatory proteins, gntR family